MCFVGGEKMNGLRNKEKLVNAVEKIWKLDIDRDIKKKFMDELIWHIGTVDGQIGLVYKKYDLKHRSEGVVRLGIGDTKKLHQEHVIPRKILKNKLVDAKNIKEINKILKKIKVCVVTREEHKRLELTKKFGWEKYKSAGIKVFDVSGKEPKRLI